MLMHKAINIRTSLPPNKMAISISVPPDKGGKGGYIPYNQTLTKKAQENRKNPTSAEKKLWVSVLQDKQLADLKFTRQKPLDQYIVDFYCAERMLVIEIDGDTHTDQMDYDSQRTARLEDLGVKVIRYTNNDVLQNIEGVCSDLLEKLNAYGSPLTRGVRGVISPPTKVINPLNPPYQGESEA